MIKYQVVVICMVLFNTDYIISISHLCILIIILCGCLCLFIYNQHNLKKLSKIKRNSIFTLSFISLIFIFTLFIEPISAFSNEKVENGISIFETNEKANIAKIGLNKIIIVGDSRMEYMADNEDIKIPDNIEFIAKSGATTKWLKNVGMPLLEDKLEHKNDDYIYHVVFNMGVNDISYSDNTRLIGKNYYQEYSKFVKKYSDVNFYLLSINPIDETIINDNFKTNKRTTSKIETLNSYLVVSMKNDNFNNLHYCDSYHNVKFETPDGLHYDTKTDQKIIDYITNNCIDYK